MVKHVTVALLVGGALVVTQGVVAEQLGDKYRVELADGRKAVVSVADCSELEA